MVTIKKFTQYLIAVGIAFLVFSATLVSENTKFFLFSQSVNPFDQAVELNTKIHIEDVEKGREVLSSFGEFLILFPGSTIDFSGQKRDIITGDVFYSSLFLHPEKRSNIRFRPEQTTLVEGQIRIGRFILQAPQSSVLISRDEAQLQTELYVWGHQASVFWESLDHPLIIPANTKVSIADKWLSDRFTSWSYEELKETFQWQSIDASSLKTTSNFTEEKLALSLQRVLVYQEKMNNFAFFAPEIWKYSSNKSPLVALFSGIEALQDQLSFGLKQRKDSQREFSGLIEPFVKSNTLIRSKKTALGTRNLQEFSVTTQRIDWRRLLEKNVSLAYRWNSFLMAHDAWTQNTFGDAAENFAKAWREIKAVSPIAQIDARFFLFEKFMTRGLVKKARKEIEHIKKILETGTFSPEAALEITNTRRLLGEYLKREELLHNETSFELFSLLVKKELDLHQDESFQNEIKIEVVHDVFFFLNTFLENRTKIEVSRILLQLYESLSVEELIQSQGTKIMTPEEREFVSFLVLVGSTGLTPEEIALIKEKAELQKALGEQIDEVHEQKEFEDLVPVESGQVRNAKYLSNLLEEIGVPIDSLYFSTNRAKGITTFRDGQWRGLPLSGTFHYPTQFFQKIQIGSSVKENFHARFLPAFLSQIEKETSENTEKKIVFVSQSTPQAILERKFIQELLALHGFNVAREGVLILDASMTHFQILGARLEDSYRISFFYNRDEKTIETIEFQGRKKKVILHNESFPLLSARETIRARIEKELKR